MGDVIKQLEVSGGIRVEKLNLYFDSGSPITLIKLSPAKQIGVILKLPKPRELKGLGNGNFYSEYITEISIKLLDIWCPHLCYVINDEILEESGDILVGHDFMQRYDIKLDLKKRDIIVDKSALLRGLRIKMKSF